MKLKIGKKSGLKYFDINDIRSWNPCYNPKKHLSEDFRGTVVTILKNENIPFEDRLWVVLRNDLISDRVMRLFAVWSYRQTLKFVKNQDKRSINAANIAEKYANGKLTKKELKAAERAAWSVVCSADESAEIGRAHV